MTRQQAVEAIIEKRRKMVNSAIEEDLPIDEPRRLYEASRYLLEAGGKRLRPTITLLAAEALADVAVGSEEFRAFPAADRSPVDIMDDDDMRRGVPAVHREYDLSTAILAGDTLYSKAFENMLDTGAPAERSVRALSELATTCTEICEGQSLDIQFEQRPAITPDEYLGMVELKTAVLYAAAASIPAVLLGHDEAVEPLHSYGLDIGRAFQIQDDLLDLTTPTEKLGKQRGSDLVEGKQTIITVHARDQGVDIESLVDTNSVEAVTEAEIDDAVAELERAGSIEYARSTARELVDSGKSHLDVLPENESHELLNNIADYLIEREY